MLTAWSHPVQVGSGFNVDPADLVPLSVPSWFGGPAGAGASIPVVQNAKLANYVRDLHKGALMPRPIGTGSTADAIRYERWTGSPVGGKFHTLKGQQYLRGLDSWLANNRNASWYDQLVARSIRDDLFNALRGR